MSKDFGSVQAIDTNQIRRFEGQPREHFDEEALKRLALSIQKIGQKTPIKVFRVNAGAFKFELIDGERRFRACASLGIPVKAWIREDKPDEKEHFLDSVVSNLCSASHDVLEIYNAVMKIRGDYGYTFQQTADVFGKSMGWAVQMDSLSKLAPEIREKLSAAIPERQRLTLSHALQVARIRDYAEQGRAVRAIQDGSLKLAQVKHLVSQRAPRRPVEPRREREKIGNVLGRANREIELLNAQAADYFEKSFMLPEQRKEVSAQIGKLIERLQALKSSVDGCAAEKVTSK